MDRHLARGLFLTALALAFGLGALRYPIGDFSRAGPGLFPLMVSSLLLLVGIVTIIQSRFVEHEPLQFNWKNIGLIMLALSSFALVSMFVNMILGIVAMVFIASAAGSRWSWQLNLKIAAGLVAVAFAFQKLLGLNLPLY
jgi:hypothetical protein